MPGAEIRPLTAIRGLAAWWVVLYHFREPLAGLPVPYLYAFACRGYQAVDFFFILSGFIMTLNYLPAGRGWLAADARRFLILRLARIYPLHLAMLLIYLLVPLAITLLSAHADIAGRFTPAYFALSLLLIQNWGLMRELDWNVPAWSISTEWGAYLVFAGLARPFAAIPWPTGGAIAAIAALLGGLAALCWFAGGDLGSDIPHQGLVRCILEFAIGCLLFRLYERRAPSLATRALLGVGALGVLQVVFEPPDYALVPLLFALLILGLTDATSIVGRALSAAWLEAIGTISYSTYLSHYFIRECVKLTLVRDGNPAWLGLLVYLVGTAGASVVLYRLVEVPGRRWLRGLATARLPRTERA